jgi:hypothetical protein
MPYAPQSCALVTSSSRLRQAMYSIAAAGHYLLFRSCGRLEPAFHITLKHVHRFHDARAGTNIPHGFHRDLQHPLVAVGMLPLR